MKEYSDGYLMKLWRQAVLKLHNNRCFFCGASIENVELEVHHHIHRRNWLLRFDYRNGFPCCKYPHKIGGMSPVMSCHQWADSIKGKSTIMLALNKLDLINYFQERQQELKQYLQDHNMSRAEFKALMYNELKKIIGKMS